MVFSMIYIFLSKYGMLNMIWVNTFDEDIFI